MLLICFHLLLFFFNDTAPTEIYTLSLHDALPISPQLRQIDPLPLPISGLCRFRLSGNNVYGLRLDEPVQVARRCAARGDRKSTRLNSSHVEISYAVFCLKKKKKTYDINKYKINKY